MRATVSVWLVVVAAIVVWGAGLARPAFGTGSAYCNGRSLSLRLVLSHDVNELQQLDVVRGEEVIARFLADEITVVQLQRSTHTVVLHSVEAEKETDLSLTVEGGEGSVSFRGHSEEVSCDLAL